MFGNKRDNTPFGRRLFGERLEAQRSWPFLTSRDLDKISTEHDLVAAIRRNTTAGPAETAMAVRSWMTGHFIRLGSPSPSEPLRAVAIAYQARLPAASSDKDGT